MVVVLEGEGKYSQNGEARLEKGGVDKPKKLSTRDYKRQLTSLHQ